MQTDRARDVAFELLHRLLAGERELVPLNLAMLLEKSARLDRGDDPEGVEEHYRQLHLPAINTLRLWPATRAEIIDVLCAEITRNPDEALMSALCFIGTDLPVRTVAGVLTNPPRPLTIVEYSMAISIVNVHLSYRLAKNQKFLPQADLERLFEVTQSLLELDECEGRFERSARICIEHHAPQLLDCLKQSGIGH